MSYYGLLSILYGTNPCYVNESYTMNHHGGLKVTSYDFACSSPYIKVRISGGDLRIHPFKEYALPV